MRAIGAGLAILPLLAFSCGQSGSSAHLPRPLDAYPDKEALGRIGRWHLKRTKYVRRNMTVLISWSWDDTARNWTGIIIDDKGNASSFRELYNWAHQGGSINSPERPKDLAFVKTLVDRLGPSVARPPDLRDVLIVSFERNKKWDTRLYRRDSALKELVELVQFFGAGGRYGTAPWLTRH